MPRYTKKDKDGRYYIESVNGKLESNIFGHTYGEAIDRFAELENADFVPRAEVAREFFEEANKIFMGACMSIDTYTEWQNLKEKYTKGGGSDV